MMQKIDVKSKNKETKNIYLEKIGDREWIFNYESVTSIMDRFNNSVEDMENGKYEKAAASFQRIIEEEPLFLDAYCHLAIIFTWSGKSEEGDRILEKGIENILTLFPDDFFDRPNCLEWGFIENRPFLRS